MNKNRINKSIIICALICASISFIISLRNFKTTQELAQGAEIKLHEKEALASTQLAALAESLKEHKPKDLFENHTIDLAELYKKEGIAVYVYYYDSLCFWSDNQPAIDLFAYTNETTVQLIKIRNGWFELIQQKKDLPNHCSMMALIAIKPEYDFQNKYLF